VINEQRGFWAQIRVEARVRDRTTWLLQIKRDGSESAVPGRMEHRDQDSSTALIFETIGRDSGSA
jgi:hypothetical protein